MRPGFFYSFRIVRFPAEGATSDRTRAPFVYRTFFCLDRITEAIQCNAGCSWSHYILERRVASNCMAVARDTRGQQRGYRWTGANSEHDEDDSPIHPMAETKATAPIMPYDGCGFNQFG